MRSWHKNLSSSQKNMKDQGFPGNFENEYSIQIDNLKSQIVVQEQKNIELTKSIQNSSSFFRIDIEKLHILCSKIKNNLNSLNSLNNNSEKKPDNSKISFSASKVILSPKSNNYLTETGSYSLKPLVIQLDELVSKVKEQAKIRESAIGNLIETHNMTSIITSHTFQLLESVFSSLKWSLKNSSSPSPKIDHEQSNLSRKLMSEKVKKKDNSKEEFLRKASDDLLSQLKSFQDKLNNLNIENIQDRGEIIQKSERIRGSLNPLLEHSHISSNMKAHQLNPKTPHNIEGEISGLKENYFIESSSRNSSANIGQVIARGEELFNKQRISNLVLEVENLKKDHHLMATEALLLKNENSNLLSRAVNDSRKKINELLDENRSIADNIISKIKKIIPNMCPNDAAILRKCINSLVRNDSSIESDRSSSTPDSILYDTNDKNKFLLSSLNEFRKMDKDKVTLKQKLPFAYEKPIKAQLHIQKNSEHRNSEKEEKEDEKRHKKEGSSEQPSLISRVNEIFPMKHQSKMILRPPLDKNSESLKRIITSHKDKSSSENASKDLSKEISFINGNNELRKITDVEEKYAKIINALKEKNKKLNYSIDRITSEKTNEFKKLRQISEERIEKEIKNIDLILSNVDAKLSEYFQKIKELELKLENQHKLHKSKTSDMKRKIETEGKIKKDFEKYNSQISQAKKSISLLNKQIKQRDSKIQELNSQILSITHTLNELQNSIQNLNEIERRNDGEINSIENMNKEDNIFTQIREDELNEDKKKEAKEEIIETNYIIQTINDINSKYLNAIHKYKTEINEMKELVNNVQNERTQLNKKYEIELQTLHKTNSNQTENILEKNNKILALENKIDILEKSAKSSSNSKIMQLNKELNEYKIRVSDLEKQMNQKRREEEFNQLQNKIKEKEKEITYLNKSVDKLKNELLAVSTKLDNATKELIDFQKRNEDLNEVRNNQEKELQVIKIDLENKDEENTLLFKENKKLQETQNHLNSMIEKLEASNVVVETKLNLANQKTEEKLRDLKNKYDILASERLSLVNSISTKNDIINKITLELTNLKLAYEKLDNEKSSLMDSLLKSKSDYEILQKEFQDKLFNESQNNEIEKQLLTEKVNNLIEENKELIKREDAIENQSSALKVKFTEFISESNNKENDLKEKLKLYEIEKANNIRKCEEANNINNELKSKIINLESQVTLKNIHNTNNQQFFEKINILENNQIQLKKEIVEKENKNKELELKFNKLSEEKIANEKNIKKWEEENKGLNKIIMERNSELVNVKEKYDNISKENQQLEIQVKKKKDKRGQLKLILTETKLGLERKIEVLEKSHNEETLFLQSKIEESEIKIKSMNKEIETIKIDEESKCLDIKKNIIELHSLISKFNLDDKTMKEDLESLNSIFGKTNDFSLTKSSGSTFIGNQQYKQSPSENDELIEALNIRITSLVEENKINTEKYEENTSKLKGHIELLTNENANLVKELTEKENEIYSLRKEHPLRLYDREIEIYNEIDELNILPLQLNDINLLKNEIKSLQNENQQCKLSLFEAYDKLNLLQSSQESKESKVKIRNREIIICNNLSLNVSLSRIGSQKDIVTRSNLQGLDQFSYSNGERRQELKNSNEGLTSQDKKLNLANQFLFQENLGNIDLVSMKNQMKIDLLESDMKKLLNQNNEYYKEILETKSQFEKSKNEFMKRILNRVQSIKLDNLISSINISLSGSKTPKKINYENIISNLQMENRDLLIKIRKMESQKASPFKENSNKLEQKSALQENEKLNLQNTIMDLNNKIVTLEKENLILKSKSERESLRTPEKTRDEKIKNMLIEIQSCKDQLEQKVKNLKDLNEKYDFLESELTFSKNRENNLKNELKEINDTLLKREKNINDLLQLIKEDEAQHESEKDALMQRILELEEQTMSMKPPSKRSIENEVILEESELEELKDNDEINIIRSPQIQRLSEEYQNE